MKTEIHEQCNVCFEVLDATHPTTITADILDQLQLLITKINIKLLGNSPICDTCLEKVKSACKFKTSYLDLQDTFHHIKLEEDAYSEKPTVCEICKSILSSSDTIPLFDPVTKINKLMLINHLSPELESKVNEDPQTCESCHKSMLNFCNITNLLSVFDQDTVDDSETPSTTIKKERQDVDCSLVSASSSTDISIRLKKEESPSEEDEEKEGKDCNEYEEFMSKNEEVDLKMDCDEEQGDERTKRQREATAKTIDLWIQDGLWTRNEPEEDSNTTKQVNSKEIMFQCDLCEFRTSQSKIFNNHLLTHNSLSNLFQHETHYKLIFKNTDELKMFQCEICDYKARRKADVKTHILIHKKPHEIEMFQCNMCDYKARQKSHLKTHMLTHKKLHELEMFQCEMCDYKAIHKSNIRNHMLTHKKPHEIEIFQCGMCDYKAKRKGDLKTHMLIHKEPHEIEMFQCEICNYKARQKGNLKIHMLIHKKHIEIETFRCDVCEFKTKYKSSLIKHMQTHKRFSDIGTFHCTMCDHKTIQKSNLKKHMLTHKKPHEIEMFQCGMCDYKAIQKSNLKRHMLTHNKLHKKVFSM